MAGGYAKWVRVAVDYAAPIAFVATLLATHDFQRATWVLVIGCAVALGLGWIVERRLAILPLFAGLMALVFGSLTLIFHDPSFVKMKLTFVDTALAVGLIGGIALGKNPLKSLLGDAFALSDSAWRVLTIRYAVFFVACAVANEAVWRTQTSETWGLFRLGLLGAAVAFSATQAPFLIKHSASPDEPEPPEPPDPGF